ncbi:MAG: Glycosyl transferase family 39 [Candidatus Amesbacteria bacterium GW2011_GWB1_47_26]|uniref:Glycosyl transferase family 39 n=1 Tax=Candidatus Amesbacteria bacterium GW2011_GWC2_45_19 TaxID=1618366 RepID=A0A0G1Q477_9BACT|nr:MAG: Glycosyl transferase family 39 [Candidatus Amesbacteria bacterium GW2011_GWC2_45_19]KKU38264.1 MAG: Glycosyl transferase family 39 [Candidatus Amesbacteria bacterium GW2011_GWA1_46_35]KKU69547.1 MAG: Glycosyl transferase family 39 [Microgenomates group bacterium GW2011_GWC1_47_20]KKU74046.1 MAG: Glycosyl transferase family 39 [Candidatus Amesbacteria bacterium GW2011_GWB1_47_26]KKU79663.1 MAG: Glycosyl transferase family 39 [Candidatus Amesbacteria bacterium GW2011_GWA2_47_70]
MIIFLTLLSAFFLRIYRVSDFLGFWYDQGRDALVIWDLLHKGKFFLIGPTTGIEGIFLGPFYYYFIAPAYALGRGHPAVAAVFLALVNAAAIYLVYLFGRKYFNQTTGLLAAILISFSTRFMQDQRWLSNPTPLPLFAIIALHALMQSRWWLLGLSVGLSLQLEAASAIFFLPAILVILHRKFNRHMLIGLLFFGLTLMPQIIFNFRHQNILFGAFKTFLVSQRSFQPQPVAFLSTRLKFYYDTFTPRYFRTPGTALFFSVFTLGTLVLVWRKLPNTPLKVLLIWWLTPMVLLLFYHGNKGYVWDYYFTGVFPALTLLISAIWVKTGRKFAAIFLTIFLYQNLSATSAFLRQPQPAYISLTPQIQAVDWIYSNAAGKPFNTDAYVPPVIPYAYDYLFLWRGRPETRLVADLYTIQEPDPGHPGLLNAWLARQDSYSSIKQTVIFGPLTVQHRTRR